MYCTPWSRYSNQIIENTKKKYNVNKNHLKYVVLADWMRRGCRSQIQWFISMWQWKVFTLTHWFEHTWSGVDQLHFGLWRCKGKFTAFLFHIHKIKIINFHQPWNVSTVETERRTHVSHQPFLSCLQNTQHRGRRIGFPKQLCITEVGLEEK